MKDEVEKLFPELDRRKQAMLLAILAKAQVEAVRAELQAVLGYNADIDNYGWEKYIKARLARLESDA